MNLKTVTIADLTPHPDNPNTHPDKQIDALADSLTKFTQVKNVVIWNDRIIAGHGVIEAAKKAGILTLEAQDISHWSEDKATEFMLADIRLPDMGIYDEAAMAEALRHIDEPLDIPGFDEDFLAGLDGWEVKEPPKDTPPQVDRAEELRIEWGTEGGQIWQIGEHRLGIGDCTDRTVVEGVMGGERADIIIADPPYGINLFTLHSQTRDNSKSTIGGRQNKDYRPIIGDDMPFDRKSVDIEASEEFWFGADYYIDTIPSFGKDGAWLVWDKRQAGAVDEHRGNNFELIWSKKRHKRILFRVVWSGVLGHIKSLDGNQKYHPTQKSVKLISEIINEYARRNDLIFDPFLGSGTTMIAAHQLSRRCYGIEIDPGYAAVCLQRMKDTFSQTGELTNA